MVEGETGAQAVVVQVVVQKLMVMKAGEGTVQARYSLQMEMMIWIRKWSRSGKMGISSSARMTEQ